VLIPSVTPFRYAEERGMDFVNFSVIYLVGRYLRVADVKIGKGASAIIYVASTALCFGLTILLAYRWDINNGWQSRFYAYNNILVYCQAVALFYFFKNLKLDSKDINWLAPSFFYVYILHSAPALHDKLYQWISLEEYYYSDAFVLHIIVSALLIFALCVLFDIILRRTLLERLIEWSVVKIDALASQGRSKLRT